MIRAVIIDDEQHCRDRLGRLLADYCPTSVHLVGMAQSVDDGIRIIAERQPELVFLDVQLHTRTGFDLLKQMNPVPFKVIFTTAFEQYAVQAFKFSAIDYLLKPIDPDDLIKAVARLTEKGATDNLTGKLDALFHNLNQQQAPLKRIGVPVTSGFVFLEVNDIIRCQSEINYTTIFLKDKQKFLVARTLKEFEELLTDAGFFRFIIHT